MKGIQIDIESCWTGRVGIQIAFTGLAGITLVKYGWEDADTTRTILAELRIPFIH